MNDLHRLYILQSSLRAAEEYLLLNVYSASQEEILEEALETLQTDFGSSFISEEELRDVLEEGGWREEER